MIWLPLVEQPYQELLQPLQRGHHLAVLGMLARDPHPGAARLCHAIRRQLAEVLLQQGRRCCARTHLLELRSHYPKNAELKRLWQLCQSLPPAPDPPALAPLPTAGRLHIVADDTTSDREFFRRLLCWQPPPKVEVGLTAPDRFRRLFQNRFAWVPQASPWDGAPSLSLLQLPITLPVAPDPAVPRALPGQALRLGLVWSDGQGRGVALNAFAELASLEGLEFHSLQLGPAALQARWPPPGMRLRDWSQRLPDWAATAEVLQQLDLLIAVDSAVACLARGLGRPCWLLGRPPFKWGRLKKEFATRSPSSPVLFSTVLEDPCSNSCP